MNITKILFGISLMLSVHLTQWAMEGHTYAPLITSLKQDKKSFFSLIPADIVHIIEEYTDYHTYGQEVQLLHDMAIKSAEATLKWLCIYPESALNTQEKLQELLKIGAKIDSDALCFAYMYKNWSMLKWLICEDSCPQGPIYKGFTLLRLLVKANRVDLVAILLSKGASACEIDPNGQTLLTIAKAHNYTELMALLKKYGAS